MDQATPSTASANTLHCALEFSGKARATASLDGPCARHVSVERRPGRRNGRQARTKEQCKARRTRTGRCLHKMYKGDETNSGGEAPHSNYCSRSGNLVSRCGRS
jgi:hypothetical protein